MSSTKIDRFEILLNSPDHTFSPGEIITGRVIVQLNKPMNLRSLKLRFKGKAVVHWKETTGPRKNRTTTNYRGEEQYLRTDDLYLLGEADGENVNIAKGSHSFPFEYGLPRNIPSTYETTHGSIGYTIKAIMDRPWRFDPETSIAFTVETPHDLTQSTAATVVIDDEGYERFACFPCINMGHLKYNIFLPSHGFAIGDAIQAKININNASESVDVSYVTIQLNQTITLHSQHPRKNKIEKTVVQRAVETRQLSKMDEVVLSIQVPSLPYSGMVYCNIIDIEYYLIVVISVDGCQCDIQRKYPIEIGSKSAESVENPNTISAIVPSAPFFHVVDESSMPIGGMPMPYPPPHGKQFHGSTGNKINAPDPGFSNPIATNNYIPGNQPCAPAMPSGHLGFVNPNAAQANSSDGRMENLPPSYDEAMGLNEKH